MSIVLNLFSCVQLKLNALPTRQYTNGLCHWQGYGSDEDSYEPLDNIPAMAQGMIHVRILRTIQQRWPAVMDGTCSLEPQRTRLSGLGQSRELQLPRRTASAPAAIWALWSDTSVQYR